jgi:hypothetical protein
VSPNRKLPIVVDPEFQALLNPLSPDEVAQLEQSIRKDGMRERIVLWEHEGKAIIVDGHNRYRIDRKLLTEAHPQLDPLEENEFLELDRNAERRIDATNSRYAAKEGNHGP